MNADVIIVGAGIAGLVAAAGRRVLLVDQEGEQNLGGQAFWSLGGFRGGGMMGYNALEGTFLGGCLFSGRVAGRSAAAQVG